MNNYPKDLTKVTMKAGPRVREFVKEEDIASHSMLRGFT